MDNVFKFVLVLCLGLGATFVGYKFLAINVALPFQKKLPENTEAVLTTEQIEPAQEEPMPEAPQPGLADEKLAEALRREEVREKFVGLLREKEGAEIIDSKVFEDKQACDSAVRNVMAEYTRRGIPASDMAETAPFPGSTGLVVIFTYQNQLTYFGCYARDGQDWALYVQFRPGVYPVEPTP